MIQRDLREAWRLWNLQPMSDINVMRVLRESTRREHREVECAFDLKGSLRSLDSYRALLESMWRVHSMWEEQAALSLGEEVLCDRRKTPWLREDLRSLGVSPALLSKSPRDSLSWDRDRPSEAWGAFYVLEGSTLGGSIVYAAAQRELGVDQRRGGRFFHGYGSRTRIMWAHFSDAMERESRSQRLQMDAAVAGARKMFQCMTHWLVARHPHVEGGLSFGTRDDLHSA